MTSPKKRLLTGDRPTGRLHIGHYVGSLQNRVRLQDEYDSFIEIADIQALTTHFKRPELISESIMQVAMDNLSVGLDPNKVTIFLQSQIPSIAEMTIFYSMLVTMNVLRQNPTVKSEAANYGYDDMTYGFFGYPVSQAADITFCGAHLVPVGEDQAPHIELCRKLVRRFNDLYAADAPFLIEPKMLVGDFPRLPGLDGNAKMGKSLGNAIYLSDPEDELRSKVMTAVTDPSRIHKNDPGHPDICVVATYHSVFTKDQYDDICDRCKTGSIGCVACKKELFTSINGLLTPFREKRAYYESHLDEVRDIIQAGNDRANAVGNETSRLMKEAMHLVPHLANED